MVDTYNFCHDYAQNWDEFKFSGERITGPELTENMHKGMVGERHVINAFNKLGIPIQHTDLDDYARGSGCDIYNHELGIYGEVKNTAPTYKFTDEFFNKKILSRYPKRARFKFLAIPSIFNLQKDHIETLKRENIRIIEFGRQVTEWSNHVAQTLIRSFYYIKVKVRSLLNPILKIAVPVLHSINSNNINLEFNRLSTNTIEYNDINLDVFNTHITGFYDNRIKYNIPLFNSMTRSTKIIKDKTGLNPINYNLWNIPIYKTPARPLSPCADWGAVIK